MTTAREENLLLLIEILTKEVSAIGQACSDARWMGRYQLKKMAVAEGLHLPDVLESDIVRDYDSVLRTTVEGVENIGRLALERVQELSLP